MIAIAIAWSRIILYGITKCDETLQYTRLQHNIILYNISYDKTHYTIVNDYTILRYTRL